MGKRKNKYHKLKCGGKIPNKRLLASLVRASAIAEQDSLAQV